MDVKKIYNRLLDSNFPFFEAIRRNERGFELTNVDEFLNDLFDKDNK